MRRSDEEFKTELMLRVNDYRAVQRRRRNNLVSVMAAVVFFAAVMKITGILGMKGTEDCRQEIATEKAGMTETAVMTEAAAMEITTVDGVDSECMECLQVVSVRVGQGNWTSEEYTYSASAEYAASVEYSAPAVTEQMVEILQSFISLTDFTDEENTVLTEETLETFAESGSNMTQAGANTETRVSTATQAGTAAESSASTATQAGNIADVELSVCTVTVCYDDGTEYVYFLRRGTDFQIIQGEDNTRMTLTESQWTRLEVLLEDFSKKQGE